MDPATPVYVAKGAAATSIAAGTFTALHALLRGSRHPAPLAFSSAVNGGLAGAIFFGIREAVVTPLIQTSPLGSKQAEASSNSTTNAAPPTWTQLRMHRMLDTTVSGALTGAVINRWQNGRVWAGARTAALLCALLQLGYNETGVMRIKYVSRKLQETQSQPQAALAPVPVQEKDASPKMSFFDRAMSIIGFRKLTDEEYLKTLKKQRDEALARIAALERERAESLQAEENSGASEGSTTVV